MAANDSALSLQGLGRFKRDAAASLELPLDPSALAAFNALLEEVCEERRPLGAGQIRGAAQQLLQDAGASPFVEARMREAGLLRRMTRDVDWPLAEPLRQRIEGVLDYIDRAEDLIPDGLPVIGLLDDAILVELFLRRAGGELGDYEDYCSFRHQLAVRLQQRESALHVDIGEWLAARQRALSAERERRRESFVRTPGLAPFRIR